jgi:hypothetical protein
MALEIRPLLASDLNHLKNFTDQEIGEGYYSLDELTDMFARSQLNGTMCSFVLVDGSEILGIRLTFPPGKWKSGKGDSGLSSELWPHPRENTAYFQSLFLANKAQGAGWGGKLSKSSLAVLKQLHCQGVVCHSWQESPNNSSTRYLQKLGFQKIKAHPLYWQDVPYNCTRCKKPPCQCTAVEMYLDLEQT